MGNHVTGGISLLAHSLPFFEVKSNPALGSSTDFNREEHSSPEEKPCRACTDFKTWTKFQSQKRKGGNRDEGESSSDPRKTGSNEDDDDYQKLLAERAHKQCPLDKDELGSSTWSFLHTMAAYFPEEPSPGQQKEMSVFMKIFAKYYPCEHCAKDFRKSLRESPPETLSRTDFSQWLCKMHNEVNRKLGKPEFDCRRVDERWKDGWNDGSCDY